MSAASRFVGASLRALGLSTVLAAATASAAPDDAMPPRGDDDVVLVPYEAFWAAMPEANRGIVLSYAEYRELVDAARASRGESEPIAAMQGGVLESAVYSGRVGDDRAEVEGDLILRLFSNHPAAARLGLVGAALLSATLDGQPIAVGCNAKGESVLIATGEGTHRVRLSFSVALQRWAPESGTPGERLAFNAPRATSASLSLVRRGTFEVRTLSPWARPVVSRDGGDTRVEMAMGGESPVDLVFSPGDSAGRGRGERMLRLGEEIAMRVDASTLVLDAALTVESESPALEWEMPGQDGARFTSVRGGTVSSFASGGGTVRIRFREAPRVGDRIDVHIERAITPGSATDVMPLAVTSAARASGSMTIAGAAGVRLTVESTDGLVEEPAAGERRFRFFGAGARARLRVDALATRFNVDSETIFGLEEERTLLVVLLTASVVDGKLFHLDYPIPAGFRLRATNPPATHDADRVTFLWPSGIGAGQTATGVVTLEGDRIAPPPAVDLPIPLPVIAGAERSAAVVSVVVESSLRVEERDLIGITVRDPQTLRLELVDAGTVSLALRAIGAEARGTLHVERRPRRESATVLVHHAATRERIDTEGLLSLTVSNEPVESFTIALPAGYTEFLDVESEDGAHLVREKERIPAPAGGPAPARDRFRIGFEGKLRGTARFRFRFQRKLDSGAVSIELPEVAVENVERETGSITIEGADELELGATTTGLEELDVALAQPLPGYVLRHNLYAAFGYARHPYSIRLAVKHFPSVAVPPAVVDRADVRIAVSSDGIYEAEARYRLLNSSRQFLRVALPDGASLESAIVDGLPVKPARDRGALLVPVPVSKDAAAIDVRLFYEGRIEPLGHAGSLVAQAPALDVLVAEGGFEIFLPHGYRYLSLSEPGRPEKAISDGDPILLRFLRTFAVTSGMPLGTRSAAAPSIAADEDASLFQRRESDVSEQVEHKLQALGYVSDSESKRKADAPGAGGANEPSKRFGLEVPRRGKQAGLLSLAISLPEKGVREAYVDAGPVSEIRVSYLGESFERILFALLALFQAALSLVLRRFRVARMPVQLVVLGALYTWIPTASIVHVGPGTTLVANALFVGVVGASLLALAQWMAMKRAARIAALGAVATLLALVLAPFASADDVKAPAKPRNVLEGRTVVPFDPTKPRVPGRIDGDEKVFVPESRFRELWLRAHPEDVDLPAAFVEGGFLLSDATYEATWIEDHVLVRALLTLTLLDERATAVPLPFTGVALSSARLDDSVAPVTGAERGFVLYAKGRGAHRIALEFAVPTRVMGSGESRRIALAFGCPAIAAAQVRLTLAGVSGRVEFRNACGGQSEEAVDSTRVVTGFLGDRTTVDVVWSVSAAKERESVTPFDARIAAQVRVQPGTLLLSEDVTLRIPDPGLESVEFDVPRDLAIIAIEGKLVGAIDRATGSDRMRVHFVEPATGDVTLRIRGEVAIASTDGDLAMPLVRPRNGRRIEGTLDVADDPSLTLDESGRPHNLERVAADGDGVRRYAFSMADVELRMRLSVRRAEADLAETLAWSLGADVRRLDATWRVLAAERGPVTLTV
ncbi:MAG: hypothetical protein HYR85_16770, partial [Planctomycetes bacterium]|nr:hypothetical protein [Planctomycetota bacterium]